MAPKSGKKSKQTATNPTQPEINPNSSFTPESFEQELKALAAKAKDETWTRYAAEQAAVYFKSITVLTLIAVYSNASQLALSPVYGSIPTSRWHTYVVIAACFTGWSSNLYLDRVLPFKPAKLLPIIAICIPTIQFFLYRFSGTLTAYWGPLVTEMLTFYPLMSISVACVATYLDDIDLSRLPRWMAGSAPGLGSYVFYLAVETLFARLLPTYAGKSFFNTRVGIELALAASYALFAPSKYLVGMSSLMLLHTALFNTHVQTPMALSSLNVSLAKTGWAIIDRQESLTGYISVIESLDQGFRAMRCDHSLLGGEWVRFQREGPLADNRVAEPIYGVFAMLEAVRLVKVPHPVPDEDARALVIGMGIGTTPAALVAHGIDTTVVEIDPVVYEFASKYFMLPSNHTGVIEDAVTYAARRANSSSSRESFDYIIHDVFTGGAEPVALFTLEFLQNLDALLKVGGVIAINYAGDFALPPPGVIVNTIRHVFPSCRVFREHEYDEKTGQGKQDFANMVIFCTKLGNKKLAFREPTAQDLLNSPAREAFLMPRYEVTDKDLVVGAGEGILTSNDTQKLVKWHETSALGHWAVMRVVLPDTVWVNW
ncbi:S-adenosyl-L-methionine-dependent methyltransferase [Apodospora peruviana]|uniref:S-adenosyl-L-methionine-dependent methyltransferase n=1 Tax=Apodospora peruviana TaxID=516989 RepID=A0AAE0M261_9PEZI|nr:S-adenosyl-L-methionine-dependent methyltransferase [Apodospora peruviana]